MAFCLQSGYKVHADTMPIDVAAIDAGHLGDRPHPSFFKVLKFYCNSTKKIVAVGLR